MKTKIIIIGAGIGGLAAGARLKELGEKDFLIIDRAKELPRNLSNGVHYLHSESLNQPFPFDLKKVTFTEEVWDPRTDSFKDRANIPEMMAYSLKVMGTRHPSSIMDPGNRDWETFLPVSNNMDDLIQAYYNYIGQEHFIWGRSLIENDFDKSTALFDDQSFFMYQHMITTAPMHSMLDMSGIAHPGIEFKNTAVYVTNYRTNNIVANWLLGLYVSDPAFPPYRITVLNNIISMESVKELTRTDEEIVKYHLGRYFDYDLDSKKSFCWDTGRIFGLTREVRKGLVAKMVAKNIFPIGRFGLWNGKLIMDSTARQAIEVVDTLVKDPLEPAEEKVAYLINKLSG